MKKMSLVVVFLMVAVFVFASCGAEKVAPVDEVVETKIVEVEVEKTSTLELYFAVRRTSGRYGHGSRTIWLS
jgi:PBP1b-binding outer membrane lipoprotein LpoB